MQVKKGSFSWFLPFYKSFPWKSQHELNQSEKLLSSQDFMKVKFTEKLYLYLIGKSSTMFTKPVKKCLQLRNPTDLCSKYCFRNMVVSKW